jgi:hypothetical protein
VSVCMLLIIFQDILCAPSSIDAMAHIFVRWKLPDQLRIIFEHVWEAQSWVDVWIKSDVTETRLFQCERTFSNVSNGSSRIEDARHWGWWIQVMFTSSGCIKLSKNMILLIMKMLSWLSIKDSKYNWDRSIKFAWTDAHIRPSWNVSHCRCV